MELGKEAIKVYKPHTLTRPTHITHSHGKREKEKERERKGMLRFAWARA